MASLEYKGSLHRYRRYLQSVQQKPLLRASFYLILSLTLVIILVFAALRPTLITITSLFGQIRQQNELEQRLDKKIGLIKKAQLELTTATNKLVFLDEALPLTAHIGPWTDTIDSIASQSGLIANQVVVNTIPAARPWSEDAFAFDITISGPYSQLYQFLQILQSVRRLIVIDAFQITRDPAVENILQLNITGTIAVSK